MVRTLVMDNNDDVKAIEAMGKHILVLAGHQICLFWQLQKLYLLHALARLLATLWPFLDNFIQKVLQ